MLNVHFDFDFQTSNPPVRDSVKLHLNLYQVEANQKKKLEKGQKKATTPILDHSGVI